MTPVSTYRRRVTEAEMRAAIAQLVDLRGGRLFWIPRSDVVPAMADWPDLVILLPPRVYFVELKSQRRATTPGQVVVLDLLGACNALATVVVRPRPKHGELSYDDLLEALTASEP